MSVGNRKAKENTSGEVRRKITKCSGENLLCVSDV